MSVNYFIPVRNPMIVSATNVCNLKLLDSSTYTIVKPDMHILGSSHGMPVQPYHFPYFTNKD